MTAKHDPIIGDCPRDGKEYEPSCARCGSSVSWQECEECGGDGYVDHDCGEDCCYCRYPEDNVPCDCCFANGGRWWCLSSPDWCTANPLPGREEIERGAIEWYEVDER